MRPDISYGSEMEAGEEAVQMLHKPTEQVRVPHWLALRAQRRRWALWRSTRCAATWLRLGALSSSLAACIPADRKNDYTSIPIGGPPTVYDVHSGVVDSGDAVTLTGVVAVLPRTPADDWFVVQAPEGGEYAGIEVHLHHALPGLTVAPGDELTVTGVPTSRNGRLRLVVSAVDGIQITGTGTVVPTTPGIVADWEPYSGVLVAPGPTELLDCGELAGWIETDRDLHVDLRHAPDAGALGVGLVESGLQGVVIGTGSAWALLPRSIDEVGVAPPTDGCPTTVGEARSAAHAGRLVLPEVVVTALQPDGARAFVQDPGGGPDSGLELTAEAGTLTDLTEGDVVSVAGLLSPVGGPRQLFVQYHTVTATEPVVPTLDLPNDPFDTQLDGTLVELIGLEITDEGIAGRRSTAAGIELVDALLDGTPLPSDGTWSVVGALRVDDRTDPPGVQLLPRSEADWTADP